MAIETYGCPVKGKSQLYYLRYAFANRLGPDHGLPERPQQFRTIADQMFPNWFEWNPWTWKVIETMCYERWFAFSGCSGSAKTRNSVGFGCVWWLCAPQESSFLLCSTTMKSFRKRGWAEVCSIHSNKSVIEYGNFVDSQTIWKYRDPVTEKTDDRHAIYGFAVQEGETTKVADNIKGIHTRRQLVLVDEATAVPPAIVEAVTNLYAYPIDAGGEFSLGMVGNARNRLDQFGRFIEPADGWNTVSKDTDEWEGKPQLEGTTVKVVRFDFRKSPRISDSKCSKHLPDKTRVNSRMAALALKGAENDPNHWSNDLGFPAPEGLQKTVMTETMITKFGGGNRHRFTGHGFIIFGAYDQARTGDRPTVRFGAMGEIMGGKMGVELGPPHVLSVDATSAEPMAYQYLSQCRALCQKVMWRGQEYECSPDNFGIDVSNDPSFCDICQQEWNPNIIRVQFGAGASDDPASEQDPRPANEVYENKRAEMFFRTRQALISDQFKGIDPETAKEFCMLEYEDLKKDGTTRRIKIQDKKEFKLKFGVSPDYADASVIIMEVARIKGFRVVAIGLTPDRDTEFDKRAEQLAAVTQEADYSSDWGQDDED